MSPKTPDGDLTPQDEFGQIGLDNINRNLEASNKSRRYVKLASSVAADEAEDPAQRAEAAFPGFALEHPLPMGFSDASLETDDAPSFRNRHLNLCLCVDLEDVSRRKSPKSKRYRLLHMDGRGEPIPDIAPVTESESWDIFAPEMHEAILKAHGWRIINTDELGDDDHTAWSKSLAGGKRAYITGPAGDHHIGVEDHLLAAIFWPDGECIYTHAETVGAAVIWVSDNVEAGLQP